MKQDVLKLSISFQALIEVLAELDLAEKRRLWKWLGLQISPTSIQETPGNYTVSQLETQRHEILQKLKLLPPVERLAIVEATLQTLREELQEVEPDKIERKKQLTFAAEALLEDYSQDKELTLFTTLDNEDFYE